MIFLPLIADQFGVDGGGALWLGVLSPLALFSAVSSAHNDTLMLGLIAVALWLRFRGNWRWAVALFAVAATIKLPALAGILFLVAGQWRNSTWRIRAGIAFQSALISAAVLIGITEAAGYGWFWLGSTALSIPTQLHVLTSPTVSVGLLFAALLHVVGVHDASRNVVTTTQHFGELLAVLAVAAIVLRTRSGNVTRNFGIALLVVVILSPTVWPWYFLWGITVLTVTTAQRSHFLAVLCGLAMLLVGPGGTPMIGGNGFYFTSALLIAGLIWFIASGQWRTVIGGADRVD
jgi:alpha-1,6-mannosyltransferase